MFCPRCGKELYADKLGGRILRESFPLTRAFRAFRAFIFMVGIHNTFECSQGVLCNMKTNLCLHTRRVFRKPLVNSISQDKEKRSCLSLNRAINGFGCFITLDKYSGFLTHMTNNRNLKTSRFGWRDENLFISCFLYPCPTKRTVSLVRVRDWIPTVLAIVANEIVLSFDISLHSFHFQKRRLSYLFVWMF